MSEEPISAFAPDAFADKVAVITGGGKGIGRRIALGFARLGASGVIAGRDADALDRTAGEIEAAGAQALAVPTDIRDVDTVEALRDATLERFGGVDCLVNNAGGQFMAPPSAISDNGWRSVVDLNLNGTWNMCNRFTPALVERGGGAIVNVVHAWVGERGAPYFVHSGAARSGVVHMTRSLAPYLQPRGVRINALAAGSCLTDEAVANYGLPEEELVALAGRVPFGEPDEIAAVALFLCSAAASFVNGALLYADGAGSTMNVPGVDVFLDLET